jgi:hypothetical protein
LTNEARAQGKAGGGGMKPALLDLFSGIGAFSLGLQRATASGVRGYGPVCGLAIAPQQAKPKQAVPIIRFYAGRDNVIQPGQLALEFA